MQALRTLVGRACCTGLQNVSRGPWPYREQDVGRYRPEFGVEVRLHPSVQPVPVGGVRVDRIGRTHRQVREKGPGAVCDGPRVDRLDQAPVRERTDEPFGPRSAGKRDTRLRAAVDRGVVTNYVKAGVHVAVARDEPLTRWVETERVPLAVRDVLHRPGLGCRPLTAFGSSCRATASGRFLEPRPYRRSCSSIQNRPQSSSSTCRTGSVTPTGVSTRRGVRQRSNRVHDSSTAPATRVHPLSLPVTSTRPSSSTGTTTTTSSTAGVNTSSRAPGRRSWSRVCHPGKRTWSWSNTRTTRSTRPNSGGGWMRTV